MPSATRLCQQIADKLRKAILDGEYVPGMTLPTLDALAGHFRASNKTVQKAIHALRKEGLVAPVRGKGIFVRTPPRAGKRSRRIGLVFAGGSDYLKTRPYPGLIVQELRKGLSRSRYSVVPIPLDEVEWVRVVEHVEQLGLAGIVLFEAESDRLVLDIRDLGLPIVSMDFDARRLGVPSVAFDNAFGVHQATKTLIELGHRHIVFVRPVYHHRAGGSPYLESVEEERISGYRIAMLDAELEPRVAEFPSTVDGFAEGMLGLFGRRPAPTALVCKGDFTAKLAAERALEMGFRIPEDLSIIGFGHGARLADGRKLATVRVDYRSMGRSAAKLMLEETASPTRAPERLILPAEVVVNQSISRPAGAGAVAEKGGGDAR